MTWNVDRNKLWRFLFTDSEFLCEACERRRNNGSSRALVIKPIQSSDVNSRGQVDLINVQSYPSGSYKWILNYQDHFTKFLHLTLGQKICCWRCHGLTEYIPLNKLMEHWTYSSQIMDKNLWTRSSMSLNKTVAHSQAGARQTLSPTVTRHCWEIKWNSSFPGYLATASQIKPRVQSLYSVRKTVLFTPGSWLTSSSLPP